MKLNRQYSERGFSLVLVMVLVGTAIFFLSGALQWSSAGSGLTERNNDYYSAMAAAEGATEKVIARIAKDFQTGGYAGVESQLVYYRTLVPTLSESPDWANYEFTDADMALNRTTVERVQDWQFAPLDWKYGGFNGNRATYRVISKARLTGWGSGAVGTVKQEIQVVEMPLFEFGAFYNLPMEVDSMQRDLSLGGRVHSNTNAYFGPPSLINLIFLGDVTSAGRIFHQHHSSILLGLPLGTVIYNGASDANVSSLNLPLGTSNTPELLHQIIEIPPVIDSPLLAQERFYNKADLIILVSDTNTVATSGVYNNRLVTVDVSAFVTTTNVMWDARQQKYFHLTQVDIAGLLANYADVRSSLGTDPKIIYVADKRYLNSSTDAAGVRVVNGRRLRDGVGLTLATMNPLYVQGNFNTESPQRAALVCDALTVLSDRWDDNYFLNNIPLLNSLPLSVASLTNTINAGIITGIVPTGVGVYSGSIENVFSLLENWLVSRFTFKGSLAVLYKSERATQPYRDAGLYYMPPLLRTIGFDANLTQINNLPHGTPQLRTLIRSDWSIAQAN